MNVYIRRGDLKDIDWMVAQLKEFSRYYGSKRALFGDEAYARNGLVETIKKHLVLVAEKDGAPVGFIAGLVSPHLYNPEIRILCELFWWVMPGHRGGRASPMLLDAFVEWGKEHADWITFGTTEKTPIKESSLIRRGFHLQETSYLMEVA